MPKNKSQFLTTTGPVKPNTFNLQISSSARKSERKPDLLDSNNVPLPVTIYYAQDVLKHFQDIVEKSQLCGQNFYNPYTEQMEQFPNKAQDFTARHLQLLARNEESNVSGVMVCSLYGNLLTEDQISRIRCLVKETVVVGKVRATKAGGFGFPKTTFPSPEEVIVIDQAGYQWQGDIRNTGGVFFYPDDSESTKLSPSYKLWQKEMHAQLLGVTRPEQVSKNHSLEVKWNPSLDNEQSIKGRLDLNGWQQGVMLEFHEALSALIHYSNTLPSSKPINFKFLKAGMGFFCNRLCDPISNKSLYGLKNDAFAQLELARLKGVLQALTNYPADMHFGQVKRLCLPFSSDYPENANSNTKQQFESTLKEIEKQCRRLNLEWGGGARQDALKPTPGYMNASTNCGDPHALIGNEGGYSSVDAAIASNIPNIQILNAAYNTHITECTIPRLNTKTNPSPISLDNKSSVLSQPADVNPALKTTPDLKKDTMILKDEEPVSVARGNRASEAKGSLLTQSQQGNTANLSGEIPLDKSLALDSSLLPAAGVNAALKTARDVIPVPKDEEPAVAVQDPKAAEPQNSSLTQLQQDFLNQLEEIKIKEQDLRKRNHVKAADKAQALYQFVQDRFKDLNANKIKPSVFKRDCLKTIQKSRDELDKHRGWKQILGNLALAIIGLGVLYGIAGLVNKAVTGKFLFFKTETAEKLDELEKNIDNYGLKK